MLYRARHCGFHTAKVNTSEVEAVATMDRSPNYAHMDLCKGTLYNASSFNLHGLSYDNASFHTEDLPAFCRHAMQP
jgi:hypothetical protein